MPSDEPFVDYENLVTGAKFNYDRPQAVPLSLILDPERNWRTLHPWEADQEGEVPQNFVRGIKNSEVVDFLELQILRPDFLRQRIVFRKNDCKFAR